MNECLYMHVSLFDCVSVYIYIYIYIYTQDTAGEARTSS